MYHRRLNRPELVQSFVENILEINDPRSQKQAIKQICDAENNLAAYSDQSTLYNSMYRTEYKTNSLRENLRERIVDELFNKECLDDDDKIRLGKGGASPKSGPRYDKVAYYIIGPPASGKSLIAHKIAEKFGCFLLDCDLAKRKLPEYNDLVSGASLVHDESSVLIFGEKGLLEKCLNTGANIVIPKIGHNMNSIKDFCRALTEKHYLVYLVSVDLPRQEATKRAYSRFKKTKRYVPLSLIFDFYADSPSLNYFKLKQSNEKDFIFSGFCQISTNVPMGNPFVVFESSMDSSFNEINWEK